MVIEYLIGDHYRSCWWFSVGYDLSIARSMQGHAGGSLVVCTDSPIFSLSSVMYSWILLGTSPQRRNELGFNNCSQIIQQNKQEQVGVDLVWLKTQVMKLHFWIEAWQYPKSKLHHLFFELRFHIGGRTCKACIKIVKLSYNIRPNPTGSGNTVHVKNKGNFLLGIWVDVHSFIAG